MLAQYLRAKSRLMILATLVVFVSYSVSAKKTQQIPPVISTLQHNEINSDDNRSTPNSFVALDFSIQNAESWDVRDKPVNQVFNCVNGQAITGFEFDNVTIETFAGSFFSEAVIYFTDSNRDDDGIRFIIGANNPNPGTNTFNSNGIIDITDLGSNDIISQSDGRFFMQFYEETDDISGFVDARYTNGLLKIWGVDLTPAENCPFIEMAAQEPDLSVSYNLAENSDDTVVGNNIEYTIDIINNGNGTATNIMVQHEISPKLRFTQFTCEDGSEFVNLESPINVSNIDAQSTLQCTLFAQIIAFGEINNSISVQTNDDSDTSNNSAVATITGAPVVIPSSNIFSLLLLLSVMMYYGRKRVIL